MNWNMNLLCKLVFITVFRIFTEAVVDVSKFTNEIKYLETKAVGAQAVQNHYDSFVYKSGSINGPGRLSSISTNLERKFNELFDVADKIRQKVESSYGDFHTNVPPGMEECCHATGVTYNLKYLSKVQIGKACVTQASTSPKTRKFPNGEIEKIMKENHGSNPDLLWQHFGTEDGTSITYPKVKVSKCDSYDPRFRPFYAASATPGAKDVVVVIDKSGSMNRELNGKTRLSIAKEAARTVVDSLNPDDRIGMVAFSDTVLLPSHVDKIKDECFENTLSLATTTNKAKMILFTNLISVSGSSNFAEGLKAAFKFFKDSEKSINGEERDRVILFMTDNTDYEGRDPLLVISEENKDLNNSVVIMTYGIALDERDDTNSLLLKMSQQAKNNASYGTVRVTRPVYIKESEYLRSKMGSYYSFFKTQSQKRVHSEPYVDTFSAIGLIISVCVSAYGSDGLIGVACADVKLADLFAELNVFGEEDDSYVFIINKAGRTLKHPLLPLTRTITQDHPLLDISLLERDKDAEDVIESMKKQSSGNKALTSTRTVARGVVIKEGIETRKVPSHYYWAPIKDTDYSLCVVVGNDDKEITLDTSNMNYNDDAFVYHKHNLRDDNYKYCRNFNRKATKDTSTVFLSNVCFKDPSRLLNKEETETDLKTYKKYFEQKGGGEILKANVYGSVVATYIAQTVWMQNKEVDRYLIWRYFGTNDGIMRVYPGIELFRDYDHELRPWWRRTLSQRGKFVVTAPYVDGWGAGYLVSLCKSIYKDRERKKFAGVISADIPIHYLYNLLIRSNANCQNAQYRCMLIDVSGFVVMHPDFVSVNVDNRVLDGVHIVAKEGDIARDLMLKGIMTKRDCVDFDNNKHQNTYKVQLIQGYENGISFDKTNMVYEMDEIENTNLFMVLKKRTSVTNNCCKNLPMKSPDITECIDNTGSSVSCECLCYKSLKINFCTNKVDMKDLSGTCSARTPDITLGSSPEENTNGLPVCFDSQCGERHSEFDCYKVAGCSWCVRNANGDVFDKPCCNAKENCEFGIVPGSGDSCALQTTTTTSTPDPSLTNDSVIGIVAGTLGAVVFVLIVVVGILISRNGICRKSHDPKDDYLTAIDNPSSTVPDVANTSFQMDQLVQPPAYTKDSESSAAPHFSTETRYNVMPGHRHVSAEDVVPHINEDHSQ